jgi:hypothetical protein
VAREVVDPGGVRWRVLRRWWVSPLRPRWRGAQENGLEVLSDVGLALGDVSLGAIGAVIAIISVAAFVAFWILPLAILLVEVLVFVVLAAAGLAGRVALRRPWRLEARSDGGTRLTWHVAGWRDSRDALAAIATALERGRLPEPPLGLPVRETRAGALPS